MQNNRILVIGPSHKGSLPESYACAFERMGMRVFRFDDEREVFSAGQYATNRVLRRALRSRLWAQLNEKTLKLVVEVRPAMVLAVRASYLETATVGRLREELGVRVVNYYPDNPYVGVPLDPRKPSTQRRDLIDVLREYSTVWMWEESLLRRLKDDGVAAEFLPFGVDPEEFRPQGLDEPLYCEECKREHDVVFVGTCTQARLKEIQSIRDYPVAIWGNGWPKLPRHRVHAPVYGRELAQIYGAAKVALNVLNAESLEGHNMRTFEVPASGGVMLARYTKAQAEFFPEGQAAAYYRKDGGPGEGIDAKIDELLADATLRVRIRREGARLAAAHTYDVRAREILRHERLSGEQAGRERAVNLGIAASK